MSKLFILYFLAVGLLLAGTPAQAASSEADFKKLEKIYTLHDDGSLEMRCTKELTLNTQLAFNSLYGETFIVYNPAYQSLKIHSAYTRQADGTRVEAPENAFNEVLPRQAADAPAFNHLKEMVVTHTGLETGATIYLDYSVWTKPGYYPELDIDETMQELSPVREYILTVNIPAGKKLAYSLTGSRTEPAVNDSDGMQQYSWRFKNLPAASQLPFLPLFRNDVPHLSASTYPSQESALMHLAAQFYAALPESANPLLWRLTHEKANEADKIKAIQQYVVSRIATTPVPLDETGYRLRPAAEVIASAYGTVEEKTALLIALLKAAGCTPELVVLYPQGHTAGLRSVREWAVSCSDRYLSATRYSAPILAERGALYPVYGVTTEGVRPLSISRNETIRIEKTDTLTAAEKSLALSEGYFVKQLASPSAQGIVTWYGLGQLNSKRNVVLELPRLQTEEYTIVVPVPEGLQLATEASDVKIDKPFGALHIRVEPAENQVVIRRSLELKKQRIEPADYPAFRDFLTTWFDNTKNQLIFLKL